MAAAKVATMPSHRERNNVALVTVGLAITALALLAWRIMTSTP